MSALPLSGVRVLDLSQRLPGGYCTMLLADYGADVVKVEPPGGDFTRSVPPWIGDDGAVHSILNRNKKSVRLDLKTEEGRARLLALAESTDVVVEGYRPGVAARLGADYESLRRARPDLVYCSITGYGQEGPHSGEAGHDINFMARAGLLGLSAGDAAAAPALPPVPVADLCAGSLMAFAAILLALRERDRSGRGEYIDLAMTDGVLALLPLALADVAAGADPPERGDLVITGAFPCYGVYRTAEGRWIALGLLEPEMWERFCRCLDREEWIERQFDRATAAPLAAILEQRPWTEWERVFADADLAITPVLGFAEALDSEHVRARGVLTTVPDRLGHPRPQLRPPLGLTGTPGRLEHPAPLLGEHDDELPEPVAPPR